MHKGEKSTILLSELTILQMLHAIQTWFYIKHIHKELSTPSVNSIHIPTWLHLLT